VNRTALTPSVESYLSAIYALARDGEAVGTQAIASELNIAAPSVTEMLRRLDAHDLVEYRRGSGATLTRSGVLVARRQERRRAVIEQFITTTIGLPAQAAAEEARTLEHHLSDRLVARIGELVGEAPGAWCRRVGTLPDPE
jgi:DtxR family Mn-dependent transcriptional regulator